MRMMFGCKAAASWAQRGSGFLAWLVQRVMDKVQPSSPRMRRAYELLVLDTEIAEEHKRYRCAYVSSFIDDFPLACVASVQDQFQQIQAALWQELGLEPQGKKCWWEGGFSQQ
jgi:hypothetical protein